MNPRSATSSPPIVLTFAASDPSGGAGMQADLMTLSALGCHPLSVMTALTVQDTVGVTSVLAVDADCVEDQARTLLGDMPVAAFKTGLLGSIENIAVIAGIVADYPALPLIVDPVLASGRGDELADDEMIAGLRALLLPVATILTPNSLEARRLVHRSGGIDEGDDERQCSLADCAQRLLDLGCRNVLLTGTHADTERVINTLYRQGVGLVRSDAWERLPGSYHGSGCTLASAIAAKLACALAVEDAVAAAQDYTWRALAAGFRPGMGQFIPDRFFASRRRRALLDD
ncbi:MAG: Hydroxymethylpyrimidine/phosphomethylpyrimidine kinase [Candidatus Accumulibacter sp. BA-94]|uniref:bifunctional hydroxymethylpyrimidine kinase/phosphomethylpyrimidine kinase n=1 Tax=Accumulibacter sp. TaxID=2053492 RepID=UPI000445F3E6|nr:hydroxymethylpyrimidine/phosphomethylpyrimidine kinase [Accumulibacter sp.]EXI92429.1 MAG: Hydroxymethylpyrimidine/phosphomethylpyrimidine kinase [Candidatus Accumulibacter sp. BA-94]MBL8390306.1 hydroxymethylpyrimidine/phosphomethylpyrimidine kinase [Accumulibacter sp.]HRD87472.1 hydroxymethylpyrimidine/phosphomethylpyrimidine kinase [Accumulibacter sp.]